MIRRARGRRPGASPGAAVDRAYGAASHGSRSRTPPVRPGEGEAKDPQPREGRPVEPRVQAEPAGARDLRDDQAIAFAEVVATREQAARRRDDGARAVRRGAHDGVAVLYRAEAA